MATPNPNQINTSVLGMASAVFTSLCAALVTTAVQGNVLITKTFNVLIYGVAAAEQIAKAAEGRAKIYGEGLVANGELAERETKLKSLLRLHALEAQEEAAQTQPKTVSSKPAETKSDGKSGRPKAKLEPKPVNASSK